MKSANRIILACSAAAGMLLFAAFGAQAQEEGGSASTLQVNQASTLDELLRNVEPAPGGGVRRAPPT